MSCTSKQYQYVEHLLGRHDEEGTLKDVLYEINPDMDEEEDFMDWLKRQSVGRASEVIDILKENL